MVAKTLNTAPSDLHATAYGAVQVHGVQGAPVPGVERRATRSLVGLAAVLLAGVLVFFAFDALPFMDLPAHAGLIALRHRIAESPLEQRFFVVAPHLGPYSLFRGLGEALLAVTSPLGAVRVLAALPLLATPAAMLLARRRLHGDRDATFGYLAVVLSFGLMTVLGFASYLLGAAAALAVLTLWLELMVGADRGAPFLRRETLVLTALAPLVFLAHGHAFVIFCLCALVSSLATPPGRDGQRLRRLLHLVTLAPAALLVGYSVWLDRIPAAGAVMPAPPMRLLFEGPLDKVSLLLTPTLTTRLGVDIAVGVATWALLIAGTVATLRREGVRESGTRNAAEVHASASHTRALQACAAVVLAVFLVLPHEIGWFGFIDGRLVPVAMLLALAAIQRDALSPRLASIFRVGAPLLSVVSVGWMWLASAAFQREAQGYREVLAAVPAGARLLNLPIDPDSDIFAGHPFVHYDKLVMASRPSAPSDVWFHQGTGIYPRAANPALALPPDYVSSTIRTVEWDRFHLDDWDYALMRTRPSAVAPSTPQELELVVHQGGWWLYRSTVASD